MFRSLTSQPISEKIAEQIKLTIYQGKLRSGQRLPSERNLADQFEVGRPTVREALKRLEAIELIEIRPNSGAFVKSISAESFETLLSRMIEHERANMLEFLEIRKRLETWCVSEAAINATDEDIQTLGDIIEVMETSQDNPERLKKADIEFHKAIVAITKNTVLTHLISTFVTLMYSMKFVMELLYDPKKNDKILAHHKSIYESLRRRNPEKAREKILEHIDYLISILR